MDATKRKEVLEKVLQAYLGAPEGPAKARALDDALKAYDYLIHTTIDRYINVPYGVEIEDLEQIGRISLASAIAHYDPDRETNGRKTAFITYAIACLRKGISRWIHDSSWSKAAAEHEKAINRAVASVVARNGRPAAMKEIAEELDVSEDRLVDMARSASRNRPLYLHQSASGSQPAYVPGETEMHLEDVLSGSDIDHFDRLIQKEQARILIEFAEDLKGQLRDTAMLMFQGYCVAEIATLMGVSASRAGMIVYTVRTRLLAMIRQHGHEELFAEWLVPVEGVKSGRIRKRRRRPCMALMIGLAA